MLQQTKTGFKVLSAFLLALSLMLTFSSCNQTKGTKTTAQTVIDLNEDGSGVRRITCPIDIAYMESNLIGGQSALNSIIEQYCPECITYEFNETEYVFKLEFSSIEDYKTKVATVLGTAPQIVLGLPNSIFATGIKFSESFTSESLMQWLYNKLYDSEVLKPDMTLWDYGETTINCAGQSYQSNGTSNVFNLTYKPIDKITMNTTMLDDNKFNRTLDYYISSTTYDELKSTIKEFSETLVPEKAKSSWEDTSTGKVFKIEFTSDSVEDLSQKTNICMNNELSSVTTEGETNNIFPSNKINECINLTAFPSNEQGTTAFEYTFNFSSTATDKKAYLYDNGNKTDVTSQIIDNKLTLTQNIDVFNVELDSSEKYNINNAEIAMWQGSNDEFEESLNITFEDGQQAGIDRLQEYINEKAVDGVATSLNGNSCIISIKGNIEKLNLANSKLFGEANRFTATKSNGLSIFNTLTATPKLDFSEFFNQLYYEKPYSFSFSTLYNISTVTGETASKSITDADYERVNDNTIKFTLNANDVLALTVEAGQLNYLFVIILILAALLIITVICILIFYSISKKRDRKYIQMLVDEEATDAVTENNNTSPPEQTADSKEQTGIGLDNSDTDTVLFKKIDLKCKKCGSDLYEGMLFCTKCGERIDTTPDNPEEDTTEDSKPEESNSIENPSEEGNPTDNKSEESNTEENI